MKHPVSHMGFWITVMASLTVTPNTCFLRLRSSSPLQIGRLITNVQQTNSSLCYQRNRGSLIVTRAGPPGATTYLFAFLFPLSLLAVTIFTAVQISDKLDRDFYEELENQSILKVGDEDEDEDEDEDVTPTYEEPPTQQRTRNRPKREAEIL